MRKERFIFLPDRLLIVSGRDVQTTYYKDIDINVASSPFIEKERVPSDTKILRYTWQYANVDGSRDRRFNNNYRIPVCEYAKVTFYAKNDELLTLMVSSYRKAYNFKYAWDNMNKAF